MSIVRPPDNFHAIVPIVAGVGNALMALPMVRQLKTRAQAGRVTVIARIEAMAEPFRRVGEVDEVLVTGGGMMNQLRGITHTRRLHADLYVVPFPSNRWQYSLLARAAGADQVLMHDFPVGSLSALHFVAPRRLAAQRGIHDVEQNLNLLRLIGIEPDVTESPRFVLREDDRRAARELLEPLGIAPGQSFVAIHAGSARTVLAEAKRWPPGNYARLIEEIRRELEMDVLLLEGPDEIGVADEIISHLPADRARPGTLKLAGNLGRSAAVLERSRLYVGSDSGLAHLAAAVGTKPVTLFAPADPDRVCPFGYRDLVVKPDKPCSPCFLYPWQATRPKMGCGRHGAPMCITEITVDQVMITVRRAMQGSLRADFKSVDTDGHGEQARGLNAEGINGSEIRSVPSPGTPGEG